ncbi:MAG TPA: hypothetical protein VH134_16980 [Candidatus Dormibacteraeota bacterium]|jgi:hypothetical protein|nr:hypothetical protein [Candidatus Dormibacteraeota bacterium]
MRPVVFAVISIPALLYLLMGILIGTSSTGRLISSAVVTEGVMCLVALAVIGLIRLTRRR